MFSFVNCRISFSRLFDLSIDRFGYVSADLVDPYGQCDRPTNAHDHFIFKFQM